MFLHKDYILANEIIGLLNIDIANITNLRVAFEEDGDYNTIVKLNGCSFIDSKSEKLPSTFKKAIATAKFTKLTDKLPCGYTILEYGFTEKELFDSGIVTNKIKICGKQFYVFAEKFVNIVKGKVVYTLNKRDYVHCSTNKLIDGSFEITKDKHLTWY